MSLNPNQFTHMRAIEVASSYEPDASEYEQEYTSSGAALNESPGKLWKRKYGEAKGQSIHSGAFPEDDEPTLYEDLLQRGVQTPIPLTAEIGPGGRPMLAGGHHRLAVMARERPNDFVPVVHFPDRRSARRGGTS